MGKLTALKIAHLLSQGGMPMATVFFSTSPAKHQEDGFFAFNQTDGEGRSA